MHKFPWTLSPPRKSSVVPVREKEIDPIQEQVLCLLSDARLGLLEGVKNRVDCARCSLSSLVSLGSPNGSRPTTPVPTTGNSSTHTTYHICNKPTIVSSSRPTTPTKLANDKKFPTLDECTDSDSLNPLHLAAQGGHLTIVKFLVSECRINVNKTTLNGNTALHLASEVGQSFVVEYLGENGAEMDSINHLGWTPLHLACLWNHFFVVEYFVTRTSQKVDINRAVSDSGRTPLILAAYSAHLPVCRCLVEHGANVNSIDHQGRSALWWASYMGHVEIIRYLLETASADHTQTNADGNSPLHAACMREKVEAIVLLIRHGVNSLVTNHVGQRPADLISDDVIKSQFKAEMEKYCNERGDGKTSPSHNHSNLATAFNSDGEEEYEADDVEYEYDLIANR